MDKRYDHMISKYQHRFLEERFKDLAINRSEAPYLKIIYTQKEIKMNDLIAKFFFHKSHTTRVIKSLVSDGYVNKTIDPLDKRSFVLSITESGKVIAEKIIKVLDEWENLMNSFLEKEEKEYLLNLQKKVYEKLRIYFKEDEDIE
ncbi:MAG: MarR family transcriptional regulator [Candidatus Izemoplasmatales bacterium]|nr:MarR family transcriptional regulator [Candidatus Izemoplasmatales bacterium]